MTTETRTLIEMKDVLGIEIECPECRLTILYPVAKLFRIEPNCPHCNCDWFDHRSGMGGDMYPAIDSVQHVAQELRALNRDDRTDIHARVRLSINIDQEKQP
jgi:hypothetical protein